jgi:hypothetical protein
MTFRGSLLTALLGCVGCAILPLEATLQCAGDASCGSADAGVPDGFTTGLDGGYGDAKQYSPSARSSLCMTTPCNPSVDTSCNADVDGGADAGDAAVEACHMVLAGQQPASMCLNAGTGADGMSCTASTQCAPGFECVQNGTSDGGTSGTCRHYCCDDSPCTTMSNDSANAYFCDVATEMATPYLKVPVCFVVSKCLPLGPNKCNPGEACTIVEINDSMSLVATCDTVGTGGLDDSCETEQCQAGFACIGATGQRTCEQLCNMQYGCSGSMSCNMQSQALAAFGVGICG